MAGETPLADVQADAQQHEGPQQNGEQSGQHNLRKGSSEIAVRPGQDDPGDDPDDPQPVELLAWHSSDSDPPTPSWAALKLTGNSAAKHCGQPAIKPR